MASDPTPPAPAFDREELRLLLTEDAQGIPYTRSEVTTMPSEPTPTNTVPTFDREERSTRPGPNEQSELRRLAMEAIEAFALCNTTPQRKAAHAARSRFQRTATPDLALALTDDNARLAARLERAEGLLRRLVAFGGHGHGWDGHEAQMAIEESLPVIGGKEAIEAEWVAGRERLTARCEGYRNDGEAAA